MPPYGSAWAGACTRLMQIQMAVLFFYSGISKLRGDDWWSGDAVWTVFTTDEYYNRIILGVLASHYWLVNLATYGTILIEIAFPFLIWQRSTRPYLLAAAIFLHLQFALLMGLFYFSFVMIMGHMSFVRPEWLTRLGVAWKRADRRHGNDLRRPMRILRAVDGVVSGLRRPRADQDYVTSAPTRPPSSVTRKWKRRSTSSCPTVGRCRVSRLIDMSCCAYRDCGGRFRCSMCRFSAAYLAIRYTIGSPRTEACSRRWEAAP